VIPVVVASKNKKGGKDVVQKAPKLEEETLKKVDAFWTEI
jgi:hypothetical protein